MSEASSLETGGGVGIALRRMISLVAFQAV